MFDSTPQYAPSLPLDRPRRFADRVAGIWSTIVWGAADPFFPLKWAYWLKGAIPGARKVVEIENAKLFFPEERPDEFAEAIRAHWRESVTTRAAA